jgi:hypothetical protein
MYNLSLYENQQEYNRFNAIMQTKETLTKEEYDFCIKYDVEVKNSLIWNDQANYALNLNVYSEVEHHEQELLKEQGL